MSPRPVVPPVLRTARVEGKLASDYRLLKTCLRENAGILLALLFMGLVFFFLGALAFWRAASVSRAFGTIFMVTGAAIWLFAMVTVQSTCRHDYARAQLRQQGVRVEGRLKGKSPEEIDDGQFLYRLQYAYSWQGRSYEGEEIIEDKALFDQLHADMRLPLMVLRNAPETSMLQINSLRKQLLMATDESFPDKENG